MVNLTLSLEQMRRGGVVDELARVLGTGPSAQIVLENVKFPRTRVHDGGTPLEFWEHITREIDNGLIENGFDAVVQAAYEMYPHNVIFREVLRARQPSMLHAPYRRTGGASVVVRDCNDVYLVIDAARRLATEHHLRGPVEPGYHSAGTLLLNLPEMDAEQALHLARLLTSDLTERGYSLQFSSAANEFRDYLISPIYVEGPDQARFELTNVPASTRVREIAQGIMGEYDARLWEKDGNGKPRPTVVDQLKDDGSTRRLEPDSTLHDNEIVDHSRLHVAPQSTAGVHPRDREEALRRVRLEVLRYAEKHRDFEVRIDAQQTPTEYVFRFRAPGWAPPGTPGDAPVPIDEHEIFLVIPADFPMKAPEAFCQTPMFHPNVDRDSGYVCLGALADRYRPGMDFGELCQTLVDMVTYQNYMVEEPLDIEATRWAMSGEGQAAIESRGGRSVIRTLFGSMEEARPLEIRRT